MLSYNLRLIFRHNDEAGTTRKDFTFVIVHYIAIDTDFVAVGGLTVLTSLKPDRRIIPTMFTITVDNSPINMGIPRHCSLRRGWSPVSLEYIGLGPANH